MQKKKSFANLKHLRANFKKDFDEIKFRVFKQYWYHWKA